MISLIIPESSQSTLTPLLCSRELYEVPIMGEELILHLRRFLSANNITNSELLSEQSLDFIQNDTNDTIIAVDCNLLTTTDIKDAIYSHKKRNCDITAVLRPSSENSNSNLVALGADNTITGLSEDRYCSVSSGFELEGIYILSKPVAISLLSNSSKLNGQLILQYGLEQDLEIYGHISDRYSITISTINDYKRCHRDVLGGKLPLRLSAKQVKYGLWIENGANIESGVRIETPVYISKGCSIERGAVIGEGTILSKNCTVRSNVALTQSLIGAGCSIFENSTINGGILSEDINIGKNTQVMDNAVIGYGCRIEPNCIINSGVKIWPNKRILEGTRLSDNLVWGSVGTEHLFRNGKISGEVNVDITPEFMAKLGCAIGTMYHNLRVGISYDSAPVCSMLASAALSGLISSGVKIFSFGEQSLPMTRTGVQYYGLSMAIHISQEGSGSSFCPEIEFIEADGSYYTQNNARKLENTFFNNIFIRADSKRIQDVVNIEGYHLSYIQEILNNLRSKHFYKNMEVRTRSETLSDILELLLSEIELRTYEDTKNEFSLDISFNGQRFTLFTQNGQELDNNQLLSVITIVLLKHLNCKTIVVPVSAPSALEDMIINCGASIIKCGVSNRDFMATLIKHHLYSQFRMCFDGIYSAVTLLDYLNLNRLSLDDVLKNVPDCIRREAEIECPNSKKSNIIERLYIKHSDEKIDLTDGIKIYQNNGWVLVLPEKHRHYVRIITEATNTEAADEICSVFTNQIKKLAKLP